MEKLSLYEIHQRIDSILLEILDPETGEIIDEDGSKLFLLETLNDDKENIIEYLVKLSKEAEYNLAKVKAEMDCLKAHKERLEKKRAGLLKIIDRECDGDKRDYGFATVNYRKSESVVIDNDTACLDYLMTNKLDSCYTVKTETKVNKAELKKIIKDGVEVPAVHLEVHNNCSVR